MLRLLFGLLLAAALVVGRHEIYEGSVLLEVTVQNDEEALLVQQLGEQINLDVWSEALPSRPGHFLVSKNLKAEFINKLASAGVAYNVESDNIKEQLDLEDALMESARRRSIDNKAGRLSFNEIHSYDVVDQYLVDLANEYPGLVTVVSGGTSVEGRDIKHIRISTTNFQDHSKPVIFLQSLLHAREWITQPASLYAIRKLVVDVTEHDLLEDIDWVILPIANPDGFEFTRTNRFWRKNRATGFMIGNICMGVDLNRNFDISFATASSSSACVETFHGSAPFSEPESRNSGNIMREHADRLAMFVDIHSFGSYVLYGYGNGSLPSNGLLINLAGVQMAQAIDRVKLPTNKNYVVGNTAALLYRASGSASDFAQVTGPSFGISYTYELPAYMNLSNMNGFLVDPNFIEQAGYETWEGLKTGARFALNQWKQNRVNKA